MATFNPATPQLLTSSSDGTILSWSIGQHKKCLAHELHLATNTTLPNSISNLALADNLGFRVVREIPLLPQTNQPNNGPKEALELSQAPAQTASRGMIEPTRETATNILPPSPETVAIPERFIAMIKPIMKKAGGFIEAGAQSTHYGITLPMLKDYSPVNVTVDDLKALNAQTAYRIYYQYFYAAPGIEKLAEPVQPIMVDMAVELGPSRAVSLLQSACNQTMVSKIPTDGIIGQSTLDCANFSLKLGEADFIRTLTKVRVNYYQELVKKDPAQKKWLRQWINNANRYLPQSSY